MKKTFLHILSVIFIVTLTSQPSIFAQDSPQWHLPVGATTRLGKGWLYEIQYSPDNKQLAAAGSLGVWIYDTATDTEIALLDGLGWGVSAITYSPDSRLLVAGSANGTIRIYDTKTYQILQTLETHWRSVRSLVFSPDGSTFASGSRDRTARIWDPVIGELLQTLRGHTEGINTVAYSGDGQMLISGGRDDTLRIWDVNTGAIGVNLGIFSLFQLPISCVLSCSMLSPVAVL